MIELHCIAFEAGRDGFWLGALAHGTSSMPSSHASYES